MKKSNDLTLPYCEILVDGKKRKLYGKNKNKIYLNNGDNFKLKIFNPLQERIGVQFNMNGSNIDNDILVLDPGQEFTIDRFIGTNKKLLFSSYEIDTNNMSESKIEKVKKAIKKNGLLEILFWNEKKITYTNFTSSSDYIYYETTVPFPNLGVTNININLPKDHLTSDENKRVSSSNLSNMQSMTDGSGTNGVSEKTDTKSISDFMLDSTSNLFNTDSVFCNNGQMSFFSQSNLSNNDLYINKLKKDNVIETGRIAQGEKSNQKFKPVQFEPNEVFYQLKFKLLPFSMKPVKKKLYDSSTIKSIIDTNTYVKNESTIREYCVCGYRITRGKGRWKYCPLCGKKV